MTEMGRYLPVNLLGPGPRLVKKEFTGPRSHKGSESLPYRVMSALSQERQAERAQDNSQQWNCAISFL
jgi:hypothetical protein